MSLKNIIVDKVTGAMSNSKKENVEIERKFLMDCFPSDTSLFVSEVSLVHQAYLSIKPEVRVRSITHEDGSTKCIQTIKGKGSLERKELNISITEKEYDFALDIIGKAPIKKECRTYIIEGGLLLEVSKVDGTWYYGEIEFETEKQALKWKPSKELSKYIIEEITYEDELKMANYWNRTRNGKTE